jgi:ParB family chromosome partitioning protein
MSKLERFRSLAQGVISSATAGEQAAEATAGLTSGPFAGTSRLKGARLIALDRIIPDPKQPRKTFTEKTLNDLAASIKTHGVLQPILVEYESDSDAYKIITGERRYRAARLAGLKELPCIVSDELAERDRLYYQLVENLQRDDINAFEEADAFMMLAEQYDLKHQDIAQLVGKSRSYVSKIIKIASIPESLRQRCATNDLLTREHLIVIAQQASQSEMVDLIDRVSLQPTNVKHLRAIRTSKQQRKPKRFEFHFTSQDRTFSVAVKFKKRSATKKEISSALNAAIRSLDGHKD